MFAQSAIKQQASLLTSSIFFFNLSCRTNGKTDCILLLQLLENFLQQCQRILILYFSQGKIVFLAEVRPPNMNQTKKKLPMVQLECCANDQCVLVQLSMCSCIGQGADGEDRWRQFLKNPSLHHCLQVNPVSLPPHRSVYLFRLTLRHSACCLSKSQQTR